MKTQSPFRSDITSALSVAVFCLVLPAAETSASPLTGCEFEGEGTYYDVGLFIQAAITFRVIAHSPSVLEAVVVGTTIRKWSWR